MVREVIDHDREARGLKPTGGKLYVENDRPDWWPAQVRRAVGRSVGRGASSLAAAHEIFKLVGPLAWRPGSAGS